MNAAFELLFTISSLLDCMQVQSVWWSLIEGLSQNWSSCVPHVPFICPTCRLFAQLFCVGALLKIHSPMKELLKPYPSPAFNSTNPHISGHFTISRMMNAFFSYFSMRTFCKNLMENISTNIRWLCHQSPEKRMQWDALTPMCYLFWWDGDKSGDS